MEKLCPILMHAMPQYLDNCQCKGEKCAWWNKPERECDPTGKYRRDSNLAEGILQNIFSPKGQGQCG